MFNRVTRAFQGNVGYELEKRIAENAQKWVKLINKGMNQPVLTNRLSNQVTEQPSFLSNLINPYYIERVDYKNRVDKNIIDSVSLNCQFWLLNLMQIPEEFKFLGIIYKNMQFDGKYHITDSIFNLLFEEYESASESKKAELALISTCLESINVGSLLFQHLETPTALVPVLDFIPKLRNKLKIGNMILAADYFFSLR